MNTVSVVAALVSVAGAVISVLLGAVIESRRRRARRREARSDLAGRYRDPLLQAASSLAVRLGNADLEQISTFGRKLPERYRDYAVYESMYRFARYQCWVQIIASEMTFLDLGSRRRNRRLVERLGAVQHSITSLDHPSLTFHLLGGELWALGSLLAEPTPGAEHRARCISYVEFRQRYDDDPRFRRWFEPIEDDLKGLLDGDESGLPRLRQTQLALHALVRFLDPAKVWAPFDDALLRTDPSRPGEPTT